MKKILTLLLFVIAAMPTKAQYDQTSLLDAGEQMEKFVKAKYTGMAMTYGGAFLTTVGALTSKVTVYPNGAVQQEYNPLIFIGPVVSTIGIIVDQASYRYLKRCALYLKEANSGVGISVGLRF